MDLMDLQERYDELDTIIRRLDSLIDNITDRDFIAQLQETKYQAEDELKEVQVLLQEQYDREERYQENQYWSTQF